MKANELRIGNLVQYCGDPVQIIEIGLFGILATTKNIQCSSKFENPMLQPIPLTEEWLLKFGFEWKNNALRKGIFCIRSFEGVFVLYLSNELNRIDIEIKYVHKLQNLYLELRGEELEMKEAGK